MSLKLSEKKSGDFEIAPEGNGRAVCVDITPLQKRQTAFGEKEEFRIVFELDPEAFGERKEGGRYAVWSRGFTPSLNEKAALRKFLKQWFGRELTAAELADTDAETLIGKPANIVVAHEQADNGNTYANIVACTPYRGTTPLQSSGDFVRKQDRDTKKGSGQGAASGAGAQFRKAEQPEDAGRDDWQKVKVHVGDHAGVELGDLDEAAIKQMHTHWLPGADANSKKTANDKRLIAGLKAAMAELLTSDDWKNVIVHVGKNSGTALSKLDEAAIRALHEKWIPVAESKPQMTDADKHLVAGLKAAVAELEAPAAPAPEPEY